MKELNLPKDVLLQDIKAKNVSEKELDEWAQLAGSYEALFSKRAVNYKSLGLAQKNLTEKEFRNYILSDYTFLKRPVLQVGKRIAFGNDKKAIEAMKQLLKQENESA